MYSAAAGIKESGLWVGRLFRSLIVHCSKCKLTGTWWFPTFVWIDTIMATFLISCLGNMCFFNRGGGGPRWHHRCLFSESQRLTAACVSSFLFPGLSLKIKPEQMIQTSLMWGWAWRRGIFWTVGLTKLTVMAFYFPAAVRPSKLETTPSTNLHQLIIQVWSSSQTNQGLTKSMKT